jgi:hypothetical protein
VKGGDNVHISAAQAKFPLGQLLMTSAVATMVTSNAEFAKFCLNSLYRHASGDWGDMCAEDKAENELALKQGGLRIFSAYETDGLPKIWIITEADRSATTTLFPDEY